MYRLACGLGLVLAASQAQAADVESGRRLAQQRCAACHIVTGSPRNDLIADATTREFSHSGAPMVRRATARPRVQPNQGAARVERSQPAANPSG